MFSFCFLFLCSFVFSLHTPSPIFSVGDLVFLDTDFYEGVGKNEWDNYDKDKKLSLFNDFIKRKLSYIDASEVGLMYNPKLLNKLFIRKNMLLINNAYEHFVARPLIDSNEINASLSFLNKRVFVNHLLVGFVDSPLNTAATRTKEEALVLAFNLYNRLLLNSSNKDSLFSSFESFAVSYSDDPSAASNRGSLGWVSWGHTLSSFQSPVFSLPLSVVSSPILTEFGYHLVFVSEEAFSNYYYYNQNTYNDLAYKFSLSSLSFDSLKNFSSGFDSLLVRAAGFKTNRHEVDLIYKHLSKEQTRGRILGNKFSLLEQLDSFVPSGVLFVVNGRGFGLGWLVNKLKTIPSTKIPSLKTRQTFGIFLFSLVLEDLVLIEAKNKHVDTCFSFIRDYNYHKENIVFNDYLGFLINRASLSVDSMAVLNQYNKGRFVGEKYLSPRAVVVSEMRFKVFETAQKAANLILSGASFDSLLVKFQGGIKEPIPVDKGGLLGEAAFKLKKGGVSPIISNPDKSYSILRVENFIEEIPFTLDLVFEQIKRKLIKKEQDKTKESLLDSLLLKYKPLIYYDVLGI